MGEEEVLCSDRMGGGSADGQPETGEGKAVEGGRVTRCQWEVQAGKACVPPARCVVSVTPWPAGGWPEHPCVACSSVGLDRIHKASRTAGSENRPAKSVGPTWQDVFWSSVAKIAAVVAPPNPSAIQRTAFFLPISPFLRDPTWPQTKQAQPDGSEVRRGHL
jgi:hypothetical protein